MEQTNTAPVEPAPSIDTPAPEKEIGVRAKLWHNVAVRLADEGVPIRAISRALMMVGEEVREALQGACERGMLLAMPRDDWPPGTRRDERAPDVVPLEFEDEHLTMLAMRVFLLTSSMAKMFVAMLRRPEMTKAALHLCTQKEDGSNSRPEPTDIKIVDVFVCKLRKILPPEVKIITVWGKGYYIPAAGKAFALKALGVSQDRVKSLGDRGPRTASGTTG